MDIKRIVNLIKREEGTKLDFKQKIDLITESGRKELAKDVCAIANSKGGRGYIVIGVEDKTKNIIGIDTETLAEEQIQQIISSRCEPPIPVTLDIINLKDKKLGIITIYDGVQRPYQLRENGSFYIRRGSTTDTMRKQEIVSMLQENLNLNAESCPIIKSNIECLDIELIWKYFTSHKIEINKDNSITLMESTSIIHKDKESGKYSVTLGGLLVFSKSNNIYTPQNMIRFVNKINKKYDEIIIIQGDLISMLDRSEETLQKLLPMRYPIGAINEGIKNAVLYRDYTIFHKEIEVVIDYNSISVISPGAFIEGTGIDSHNYVKRNMWIYEKLISLDEKNRFNKSGRGFTRIKKAFKGNSKVLFINSKSNDSFKIIYPGIKKYE